MLERRAASDQKGEKTTAKGSVRVSRRGTFRFLSSGRKPARVSAGARARAKTQVFSVRVNVAYFSRPVWRQLPPRVDATESFSPRPRGDADLPISFTLLPDRVETIYDRTGDFDAPSEARDASSSSADSRFDTENCPNEPSLLPRVYHR